MPVSRKKPARTSLGSPSEAPDSFLRRTRSLAASAPGLLRLERHPTLPSPATDRTTGQVAGRAGTDGPRGTAGRPLPAGLWAAHAIPPGPWPAASAGTETLLLKLPLPSSDDRRRACAGGAASPREVVPLTEAAPRQALFPGTRGGSQVSPGLGACEVQTRASGGTDWAGRRDQPLTTRGRLWPSPRWASG